jgi:hypothetical protein
MAVPHRNGLAAPASPSGGVGGQISPFLYDAWNAGSIQGNDRARPPLQYFIETAKPVKL